MALPLARVLELLDGLAPLRYAESWDNVGLLIEPELTRAIGRVLLTIDLTSAVIEEAAQRNAELVVSYHPPIFKRGLMRVRAGHQGERAVAAALARGIAVFSPHTALDAAPEGVNDWLAEAVGPGRVSPLVAPDPASSETDYKLVVFVPPDHADSLRRALARAGAGRIGAYSECSFNSPGTGTFFGEEGTSPAAGSPGQLEQVPEIRIEMVCPRRALSTVARALSEAHPYEEPAWDVYPLAAKPAALAGQGRGVELESPASIDELVNRVKAHLGLNWVRLAAAERHRSGELIRRVAVCAGAGDGLFDKAPGFDLYLTGELRHHDVLAKTAAGATVMLCEHSSSERGYLPRYAQRLAQASGRELEVSVSEADREPLAIV